MSAFFRLLIDAIEHEREIASALWKSEPHPGIVEEVKAAYNYSDRLLNDISLPTLAARDKEKYWQEKAGRFARLANWAAVEVCSPNDITSNAIDQANDVISEIDDYMIFNDKD